MANCTKLLIQRVNIERKGRILVKKMIDGHLFTLKNCATLFTNFPPYAPPLSLMYNNLYLLPVNS